VECYRCLALNSDASVHALLEKGMHAYLDYRSSKIQGFMKKSFNVVSFYND